MIYNVYTISIGNACIIYSDDPKRGYVSLGIESRRHEDCIELGFMDTTSKNNSKRISTNNFSKILQQSTSEVHDLFMGKNGFFREPDKSCVYPIHEDHLDIIEDAIDAWVNEHGECDKKIPYKGSEPHGYENLTMKEQMDVCSEYDWVYANLLWLKFWFGQSLSNDDYPSILIKPMML